MKILLVEDDDAIRAYMVDLLSEFGHQVVEAADGKAALARFAEQPPELLLCDVSLPFKSGYAVCREVRKNPAWRDVIVILCSARLSDDELRLAKAAGAEAYLPKPFTVAEVESTFSAAKRARGCSA